MSKKILIIGYYGSDNLGDELLLKETLKLIAPYVEKSNIKVLSYHVDQTKRFHGVEGVSRNKPLRIFRAILGADIIIGGGGSMLQNVTSNRSLMYYLSLINFGMVFGKKVVLLGNGIGPIKGGFQTRIVKRTLNRVDYLHLRDKDSYDWINGDQKSHIHLGQDLALENAIESADIKRNNVIVNIRMWKSVDALIGVVKPFIHYVEKKGYTVTCLSMQDGNDDKAMAALGQVKRFETLEALEEEVRTSKFAIAMRLHTLILCSNYGVPFVGLSYDPKVSTFCRQMDMPYYESFESLSFQDLVKSFDLLEANETVYVSDLQEKMAAMDAEMDPLKSFLCNLLE
ncbi:MAG: polysaccharide pyruvyl transferase CsaB [Clostridia bacterium]|nr:polysaccharide pyruvyl transferase CsaB [Clostridia bacterium]